MGKMVAIPKLNNYPKCNWLDISQSHPRVIKEYQALQQLHQVEMVQ
jgi:hypothetical protein